MCDILRKSELLLLERTLPSALMISSHTNLSDLQKSHLPRVTGVSSHARTHTRTHDKPSGAQALKSDTVRTLALLSPSRLQCTDMGFQGA